MTVRRNIFDDGGGEEDRLTPPKRPIDGELDITPLIDCVFLLLIFFMVTSTMKGTPDVDVPVAHYGTGVPSGKATIVTIRNPLVATESPKILLGDGRGPEGDLDAVREYVEQGIRENRNHVIIKAERDVPHGFVQEVTKVVAGVEGVHFNIGVQDQR
jgi:biopolymer transport protein ExbD